MKNNRKAGFTLVELLVVISIIALLMGVLLPALSAARMRAHTIVCAFNLKSYGAALYMYTGANDDKTPFSFYWLYSQATLSKTGKSGCPEVCRWHYDKDPPDGSLWPYLKNIKAHICPTFKALAKNGRCANYLNHSSKMVYHPTYCHSMNRWLGFNPPCEYYTVDSQSPEAQAMIAQEPSLKLSQVRRSAQCCAFSEENFWTIAHRPGEDKEYSETPIGKNDLWLYANQALKDATIGNTQGNIATYHNVSASKKDEGSANIVFVDGHVSLTKGLAGYNAYFEYGRPYNGQENWCNGQFW